MSRKRRDISREELSVAHGCRLDALGYLEGLTPLLYSPTRLDLKHPLNGIPHPQGLVTRGDDDWPPESPGFGLSLGPRFASFRPSPVRWFSQ